jgi:spermidine synthase
MAETLIQRSDPSERGCSEPASNSASLYACGLIIVIGSGATALAHELLWTRRLIDVLGGTSEATGRVFGGFFLGLALGAAASTRLVGRRRPWRLAAAAEAAVALTTLPAVFLTAWTAWIWPALGPERLVGPVGSLVKLAVSFAVVVPPAFAMGLVLPLVVVAATRGGGAGSRLAVWLYAANTLGGLLGLAAVVGWALPAWGGQGAMLSAAAANLVVAGGCLVVDAMTGASGGPAAAAPEQAGTKQTGPERAGSEHAAMVPASPEADRLPADWLMAIAAVSGAGVLAFEVVALQLMMLWATLSLYAPAAILASVILMLAVAAASVPLLTGGRPPQASLLAGCLGLAGAATAATPPWFIACVQWLGAEPVAGSVTGFVVKLAAVACITLGPALLVAGLVFPLVIAGWAAAGRRGGLGWVLAANGVGGLVGAEAANRLLLPWAGIHGALGWVGIGYCLAGLAVVAVAGRGRWREDLLPIGSLAVAILLAAFVLPGVPEVNPFRGFKVLSSRAGADGSVAVVETAKKDRAILVSNQYILGSAAARWDEARQAHLPLVLHPAPRQVAFIGVATGVTPGAALEHAAVERLTAIEISPLVADAARQFFNAENNGLATDPRAELVIEDGRTYVEAAAGRFDLVVGDFYLPWGSGAGRLYSREHIEAVRRSLAPGGIFCQWLPLYQLAESDLAIAAATFQSVFPEVQLFRNRLDPLQPGLALVGWNGGGLDWEVVSRRCAELRTEGVVLDAGMRHDAGIALLWLGSLPAGGGRGTTGELAASTSQTSSPINTLDSVRLELEAAARRVVRGSEGEYLWGSRWLELAERWLAEPGRFTSDGRPDPVRHELARAGQRIAVWQAIRERLPPNEAARAIASLRGLLPVELLDDAAADRSRWPAAATLLPLR